MESPNTSFTVRHADLDDIPSLTTIVPRSFHPTNPYILKLLPNTSTIRHWWNGVFTSKLNSPTTSHLLTAASSDNPSHSLGALSLQLLGPSDHGAGFWSAHSPTSDHDAASYADVASNLTNAREALMMGQPHFVVELFGVDHETKGSGLGKKLLLKACEIADEAGLAIL